MITCIAALGVSVLALALLFRLCAEHAFDPIAFYIYLLAMLFVFRPIVLLLGLDGTIPPFELFRYPFNQDLQYALLLTTGWIVIFSTAYILFTYKVKQTLSIETEQKNELSEYDNIWLVKVSLALAAVGLLVILYALAVNGFSFAATSYNIRFNHLLSSFPLIQRFPHLSFYLLTTIVVANHVAEKPFLTRAQSRALLFIAGFMAFSTLIYASRGPFLSWLVYLMILTHVFVRRIPLYLWGVGASGIIALLIALKALRYMVWGSFVDEQPSNIFAQISDSANLDKFDNLILLIQNIGYTSHNYGLDFINGFLAIVPRALWHSKPLDLALDIKFHNLFYPHNGVGWPIGAPAEFYWSFGAIGIFIGAIITAILFVFVSKKYQQTSQDPYKYLLMFMFVKTVIQSGYTNLFPVYIINNFLMLLAIVYFARMRIQRMRKKLPKPFI